MFLSLSHHSLVASICQYYQIEQRDTIANLHLAGATTKHDHIPALSIGEEVDGPRVAVLDDDRDVAM